MGLECTCDIGLLVCAELELRLSCDCCDRLLLDARAAALQLLFPSVLGFNILAGLANMFDFVLKIIRIYNNLRKLSQLIFKLVQLKYIYWRGFITSVKKSNSS